MKKKKRKKTTQVEGGGCCLAVGTGGRAFRNRHLVAAGRRRCKDSVPILNCMRYYIPELETLHECSLLCLGILCHSCCDVEVHVGKNFDYIKRCDTRENNSFWFLHRVTFLQVSSKIPHRQGFRPH